MKLHIILSLAVVLGPTSCVASEATRTQNPFLGRTFYVNPANQAEYDGSIATSEGLVKENLEIMKNTASAYWIDTMDKIKGNSTHTVQGILADASSKSPAELVVFIWYDLPNRDCDAYASSGEICCTYEEDGKTCDYLTVSDCKEGIEEYETGYVDPFIEVLQMYEGKLPIVIVFEPDSLPNLATNLKNPKCANKATQNAYKIGTTYALEQLTSKTDVTVYLDAGHGGWLGWEDNVVAYLELLKEIHIPVDGIRGFSTDVSGYQPLGIMCPWDPDSTYRNGYCLNGKNANDACCYDPCSLNTAYDPANNELNYAQELYYAAKGILGMDAHMITDTGRNGVPDMREDCADFCNVRGAGTGYLPTTDVPNPLIIDAYYWLKTPGESDGCTKILPDGSECPRYDTGCGSVDSLGNLPGEPKAPEAGAWYDYQVKMLAGNAQMNMAPTPPPTPDSRDVDDVPDDDVPDDKGVDDNGRRRENPRRRRAPPPPPPSPAPPPPPSGAGACCWAPCDQCTAQGGWCDESSGNCDNCGGSWCPGVSLEQTQKQIKRHRPRRLRAHQGEEGDGTAMLQGQSEFYDGEELEDGEEDEAETQEGHSQEL